MADDGGDLIPISKQPRDPAATAAALDFFAWAYAKSDKMAEETRLRADAEEGWRNREDMGLQNQGFQRQLAPHQLDGVLG